MRVKTSVEMFSLRLPIARGVGLKLWVLGVWTIYFEAECGVHVEWCLHGVIIVEASVV